MKRALLAFLVAASPALAGGPNDHPKPVPTSATAHARSSATGGNATGGNASAVGGQASGFGYGGNGGTVNGGLALGVPLGTGNASCAAGISVAGLSLGGGGSAGGGLWELHDCKRARQAELLFRWGYRDQAVALLCQIDDVREAFGGECPRATPVTIVSADPFDYCRTRNAGDKNQHRECDRPGVQRVVPAGVR